LKILILEIVNLGRFAFLFDFSKQINKYFDALTPCFSTSLLIFLFLLFGVLSFGILVLLLGYIALFEHSRELVGVLAEQVRFVFNLESEAFQSQLGKFLHL
jgi:hypothetical protein